MRIVRPLPPALSRVFSVVIVLAWLGQMALLLQRTLNQGSSVVLAAELERYGASAQWKGVYYRGEKIGFTVGQTIPTADGYEIQEDGRLQMTLAGAPTAARIRTVARVDKTFSLRSFAFSLDPGSGPIEVEGALEGKRLRLTVKSSTHQRTEVRDLPEAPNLSLNISRRLAAAGLVPGQRLVLAVFDPATLKNMPMTLDVQAREVVRGAGRPVPAFRVQTTFSGLTSTSWVTDLGEVVREESPMGLITVKETRDRAMALAVPGDVQMDLLENAAVVPVPPRRIDDAMAVEVIRLKLEGAELGGPDLQGAGQTFEDGVFEIRQTRETPPGPSDPEAGRYLGPEPFIESDAPEIRAEALHATEGITGARAKAERLVRHVNALLEKKPTISLPSALEVLHTKVGDCNEHTVLYVALARALGIPARIAVGLTHLVGAFYYHAWAEVYIDGPPGRGIWLPVDPTFNQFPTDATHIRLARGGLDKQASILPLVGHVKMQILDIKLKPGSTPTLVGRSPLDTRPMEIDVPRRDGSHGCWSRPR